MEAQSAATGGQLVVCVCTLSGDTLRFMKKKATKRALKSICTALLQLTNMCTGRVCVYLSVCVL